MPAAHTLSLKVTEMVTFTVNPKDAAGNPAAPDSPVVVESLNTAVCTIAHQFGTWYIVAQAVGSAVVMVRATSGGTDVSEQINVTVQQTPIATLGIVFNPPQPK